MSKLPNFKRVILAVVFAFSLLAPVVAFKGAQWAHQAARFTSPQVAYYFCWKCGGS